MKKTHQLFFLVTLTAMFNAGISHSTRPTLSEADDGEAARHATVAISTMGGECFPDPATPEEMSLFSRTILGVTDSPEDFDLLCDIFKGFSPDTDEEQKSIDAALNRMAYETLRPILVQDSDFMNMEDPTQIQDYILRELLSKIIGVAIETSGANIAATGQIRNIARQFMYSIMPHPVVPQRRQVPTTTLGWVMDKYQGVTDAIYDYTAGAMARMPARLMSVYLTDDKGANIGKQLRRTMAGFADQLENARPYFIRSWERKLETNVAKARILRLEFAHQEDALRALVGTRSLRVQIQEAQEEIRHVTDTNAGVLEMPEVYAEAVRAKEGAKTALDDSIAAAVRRAKVRSGKGMLGTIIYWASKIRRLFIDPSDVAVARKSFNQAVEAVAVVQKQAEKKKQQRLTRLNRKLRALNEKRPSARAIEDRKRQLEQDMDSLVHERVSIEAAIADFNRERDLVGMPNMDRRIMANTNAAMDATLNQDRFYYSALSALAGKKTPAIGALIGHPSAKVGAEIMAELQESAVFTFGKIGAFNTNLNENIRAARRAVQRMVGEQDELYEAIDLLTRINAYTNHGEYRMDAAAYAENIVQEVEERLPVTRLATQRLYKATRYIKNMGKVVIPALTTFGLAYTSLFHVDTLLWGTLGTEVGILGSLDTLRTGLMTMPADAMGIAPTMLYSVMPVLGSVISYSASAINVQSLAAKTAVAGAPLAVLWFAPVVAPAVTATSLVTLMDWDTATRIATAGKQLVGGALSAVGKIGYTYLESGYQTVRGWFA